MPEREVQASDSPTAGARIKARVRRGNADGQRAASSSRLLRLHACRRLGEPHQVDELGAVAELVLALVALGERYHVIMIEVAGVAPAAEDLTEGGDRGGEASLARRCAACLIALPDGRLDQAARIFLGKLVTDLQEAVLAGPHRRGGLGRPTVRIGALVTESVDELRGAAVRRHFVNRRYGMARADLAGVDAVVVE